MDKQFLYIYIIDLGHGNTSIEQLRETLSSVHGIRGKAFVRNPQTFIVHSETDISELLKNKGFVFTISEKGEEKNGPNI